MSIEESLTEACRLAKNDDYESAEGIIRVLSEENPQNPRVSSTLAYIYARKGEMREAIREVSSAIAIDSGEPAYFFKRGGYYLDIGELPAAISDFSTVLELGNVADWKYYEESAYFYRAEAFLRSGDRQRARSDCEKVRDGFRVWIGSLRSKEDVIRECLE